ncbi:MAG: tetratricopeptide repeat protein [Pirellulales bacterium]
MIWPARNGTNSSRISRPTRWRRARYYGGVCALQQQQFDKAATAMEKVLADAPAFDKLEELYLNLGITYLNAARKLPAEKQAAEFDKAAETFGTLLKKYPQGAKTPDALYNRADALYLAGKKDAALPVWQDLVAKHAQSPLVPDALYNIGVAAQELGRPADAGKAYDDFLKSYPKDKHAAEVTLRKGMTLYEQKQFADAEKRFAAAAAIKDFSQADYALLRQGDALLELKKPADAAAAYGKLVNSYPKSTYAGDATLQTGKVLALADNLVESRKWLTVLVADPQDARAGEAAHWLARGYLKENKPGEALKIIDGILKEIQDQPRIAELRLDRAERCTPCPIKKPTR